MASKRPQSLQGGLVSLLEDVFALHIQNAYYTVAYDQGGHF
jgi:hypothetical protein